MPEITRTSLSYKRKNRQKKHIRRIFMWTFIVIFLCALITASYGYVLYARALPPSHAQISLDDKILPKPTELAWPSYGQAAVGTLTNGVLETNGEQKSIPTASTAKLITLLAVLERKPIRPDTEGPTIRLGERDVKIYNDYVAKQGSVVVVEDGENITQYQAFQAVLLASANNLADTLAIWAFGSLDNYALYANQMVQSYGLKNTKVGRDASGLSPTTTSTASDLLVIAQKAMSKPILSNIIKQKSANIPVAGTIRNTNWLLGSNGINGVKTGNTDEAGGVFILSSKTDLDSGSQVNILTTVMGAPTIATAMQDSSTLMQSAKANFYFLKLVKSGDIVGTYETPWGQKVNAVSRNTLNGVIWLRSKTLGWKIKLNPVVPPKDIGDAVGRITLNRAEGINLESEVRLEKALPGPSIKWRIFRKD